MSTLRELSEITGLSMNTVSRALRGSGYISEKTARLVRDAARRLDYHPNRAAQCLRRRTSSEIAVILDTYDAPHLDKLAAIKECAVRRGLSMGVHFTSEDHPSGAIRALLPEVLERAPAGLILITSSETILRRGPELRKKLPCVVVSADPVPDCDCVYVDRFQGAYDAVHYLHNKGRTRIAFCETFQSENRKNGYLKAIQDFGLPCIFIPGNLKNPVLIRNSGYLNGKLFATMPTPPDAVQTSDYMASGLLAGFAAIGIKVPQDIAVLGFDNRDFAALLNPPLTTLAQPNFDIGKNAANLLFKRMDGGLNGEPESVRIPMALMLRQST